MQLNTKFIISAFFGSALMLSGCTKINNNQPQTVGEQQSEFAQMANAIKDGKGAYCEITQTIDGKEQQMKYWIKGEKIKATGLGNQNEQNQYGYMISNGKEMFMWSDEEQGIKWQIDDQQIANDNQYEPEIPDFENEENFKNFQAQGYKVNCQQQNLTDEDFTPPANIQFQSMEMMMENAFGQMKQEMIQEQTENAETSNDESSKSADQQDATQQYQLMMEKYKDQQ